MVRAGLRAISSAVEHLVYTEGVGGSNPSSPTTLARLAGGAFLARLGTLWRKDLAGDEPLVMVEVVNATPVPDGSAKRYLLPVPPTIGSAREAVAWSFGKAARSTGRRTRADPWLRRSTSLRRQSLSTPLNYMAISPPRLDTRGAAGLVSLAAERVLRGCSSVG